MTRAYKLRLSQPRTDDFLISFPPTYISASAFCPHKVSDVSRSMWDSHLVTVPSTHSHGKFLLASSTTDPPGLFSSPSSFLFRPSPLLFASMAYLVHASAVVRCFISPLKPRVRKCSICQSLVQKICSF